MVMNRREFAARSAAAALVSRVSWAVSEEEQPVGVRVTIRPRRFGDQAARSID
jgi:hypothetical protein